MCGPWGYRYRKAHHVKRSLHDTRVAHVGDTPLHLIISTLILVIVIIFIATINHIIGDDPK